MSNRSKKKLRQKQRLQAKLIILGILLLWGMVVAFTTSVILRAMEEAWFEKAGEGQESIGYESATDYEGDSAQEKHSVCEEIYENNKDLLVLVNKEVRLSEDYTVKLRSTSSGRIKLAEVVFEDLRALLEAASEEAGYSYYFASGYRSADYQQKLIDADVKKYMTQYGMSREEALKKTLEETMPAGHSEHETGLAFDITPAGEPGLEMSQGEKPAMQWLQKNAWRYGFILRYPENKEEITGIAYEPWHFRYVGREAAEFLYENELTLEEFWEYVKG